jgi:RimJ/RimL family protein N-acetyltransferase
MGFEQLVLDVAATNLRAVRTYRSLGFREIGRHYRSAGHSSFATLRTDPRYRHLRRFFKRQGSAYRVLFYDMALSRQAWHALRQAEAEASPGDAPRAAAGAERPGRDQRDRQAR